VRGRAGSRYLNLLETVLIAHAAISLLVRSDINIGISQQFNLSDSLGPGLYLNCLQGRGPQEPIALNILYWRQDLREGHLDLFGGKLEFPRYDVTTHLCSEILLVHGFNGPSAAQS
jgi:hypothetical protein